MSRKFCLLGESLKHTMSPPIHKELFELSGKTGDYSILETAPNMLASYSIYLKTLTGYNITIPHKVGIIPLIDELDETAKRYGAVNCVHTVNDISKGYNTDVFGFLRSLEAGGGKLGGNVLLLGCGGVGRMMAIEACLTNSALTIAVLEDFFPQAEKVREDILSLKPNADVKIVSFENISGNFDLLINATPVGMYPKSDDCPASDNVIKNTDCVFDAIYNPVETLLLKKAKEYGKKAIGGMAMLVWQAVVAHEIWDNASYKDEDISKIILKKQDIVERDFK